MNRLLAALCAVAAMVAVAPQTALAQTSTSKVVTTCGGQSYTAGANQYPTMSTTGAACTGGGTGTAAEQVQGNVAAGSADSGNPVKVGGKYNAAKPTLTDGQRGDLQLGTRGSAAVQIMDADGASGAAVGTVSDGVNIGVIGLQTRSEGYVFDGASSLNRAREIGGVSGTTGLQAVANAPTSSANQAPATGATTVAASNLVLKASAGNLFSVEVVAGASAGYLMAFNATSAPADGAVTPAWVIPVAANAGYAFSWGDFPLRMGTGITLVFSTTGPFSKTASATAFLQGTYQ